MYPYPRHRLALLVGTVILGTGPALAQTATPVVAPSETPTANAAIKRVFTPADFARFAPKTAYDMIVQVPGFTIRGSDEARGLGQASENVLINGQRIANKSGGAIDELRKISVGNVERIEIVEAASLGIAGLSGQVANVIVKAVRKSSGQFEYSPEFRAHYAKPNLFRGSASYNGNTGPIDYTLSVRNQANRGAFGGPYYLSDRNGLTYETRDQIIHSESDLVTFQSKFGIDMPGTSLANLTLAYTPYWAPSYNFERRTRLDGNDNDRTTRTKLDGYYIDISGDYEFGIGPGRLKLIGLRQCGFEQTVA